MEAFEGLGMEPPEGVCGFELRPENVGSDLNEEEFREEFGTACCRRETWKEDRCVWHAAVDEKPRELLVDARRDEWDDNSALEGSDLTPWEHLSGASLSGSDLSDFDFRNCKLTSAFIGDGNLADANLSNSDLTDADLRHTDLSDVNLSNAKMVDVDLSEALLSDGILRNAHISNACLKLADLSGSDLSGANLSNANLNKTDLCDALLRDADLHDTNLRMAYLADANLNEAILLNAKMRNVDLTDASLENANLRKADLRGADMSNTILRGADIRKTKLNFTDFSGSEINEMTKVGKSNELNSFPFPRTLDAEQWNDISRTHHKFRDILKSNGLTGKARLQYMYERHARARESLSNNQFSDYLWSKIFWFLTGYGVSLKRVSKNILYLVGITTILYMFVDVGSHNLELGNVVSMSVSPDVISGAFFESLYFSIITFTTVGYGNLKPVTAPARYIALSEAMFGTIFVVVLSVVLANRETP